MCRSMCRMSGTVDLADIARAIREELQLRATNAMTGHPSPHQFDPGPWLIVAALATAVHLLFFH